MSISVHISRRDFLKRTSAGVAMATVAGSSIFRCCDFAINSKKPHAMSDVSFVGSSSSGTRRKMISDVLEPWRATVAAGISGKTVLIKPNMVYWSAGNADPLLALTHVDAIRGLLDFLRSIAPSASIIIGDCCPDPDLTTMWSSAGYTALTTEYTDVTLMDLNNTANMPSSDSLIWTPDFSTTATIPISSAFVNNKYYVISICRPKTHNCMIMTGVNKNILMAAPLNSAVIGDASVSPKQIMHGKNGWFNGTQPDEDKCLAYNLYQLANVIYPTGAPALSVLDSWEGMQGEGPINGTGVMHYCAIAGADPLAVDRLSAKLMGFSDTANDPIDKATPSYTDMRALVWMSNAGLGNYDLSKINFILGSLDSMQNYIQTYTLSSNYSGDPSYETSWTGGPPPIGLDQNPPAMEDSRFLDPKPFLAPQAREEINDGEIAIDFSLPVGCRIDIGIVNRRGIVIRRLCSEFLSGGRYTIIWNRRDNRGFRVPTGQYMIKLGFGSRSIYDRISLID
jgi:uncharacterized protein (DUF362 family)